MDSCYLLNLNNVRSIVKANRKSTRHYTYFADSDGVCETLEGLVEYQAGDAIVKGVIKETWPVNRTRFEEIYEPECGGMYGENGWFVRQIEEVAAGKLFVDMSIPIMDNTSSLVGRPGDWLIRYVSKEYAIVRDDVFSRTYEISI